MARLITTAFVQRLRHSVNRWLFRVGAAEPAPIRLGQRRIYVLPSAAGIAFALALLVMLLAAINYNLSLGYALVFSPGRQRRIEHAACFPQPLRPIDSTGTLPTGVRG